jgi:amino acid transporter
MQKVSHHKVPWIAIWMVAFVASFFLWFADNAVALYGAGAVLFVLFYLITIIGFTIGFKRLPTTDGFSLGRWHRPVVVLAATWLIIEAGILTIPEEFHSVAVATGGILAVGLAIYLVAGRARPTLTK